MWRICKNSVGYHMTTKFSGDFSFLSREKKKKKKLIDGSKISRSHEIEIIDDDKRHHPK